MSAEGARVEVLRGWCLGILLLTGVWEWDMAAFPDIFWIWLMSIKRICRDSELDVQWHGVSDTLILT